MEFSISIPQTHPDPSHIPRFLKRAEELAFAGTWCIEQVIGTAPVLEAVTTLAYATALTDRLRLGVAVLILGQRSPVDLAKSLSSIDVLSGGRLIVGVGLGHSTRFYSAYGLAPEGRVARFRENLEIMKRLWTEDRVTLEGRFAHLEKVPMELKPVQRPHPKIWFGPKLHCGVPSNWATAISARARLLPTCSSKTSSSCPRNFPKPSAFMWLWEMLCRACANGSESFMEGGDGGAGRGVGIGRADRR